MDIYYFSGTGNCLFVAKRLAERTGGALIPMASSIKQDAIDVKTAIGIVFPVYYMELPMIVEAFVHKLRGIQGKYVFAICTYGGAAGASLRKLKRLFAECGGELSAAFGVRMPQNSFPKKNDDQRGKLQACPSRTDWIAEKVNRRATGVFYTGALLELALIPIIPLFIRPACVRHFQKISRSPKDSPYEAHKHAMDKNLSVQNSCTGCGICVKVCPMGNISLCDGKPTWGHRCEHCLACYNWCPNKAIEGGITTKGYFYTHPDIELLDIMGQQ